jgi:hypothetical protein
MIVAAVCTKVAKHFFMLIQNEFGDLYRVELNKQSIARYMREDRGAAFGTDGSAAGGVVVRKYTFCFVCCLRHNSGVQQHDSFSQGICVRGIRECLPCILSYPQENVVKTRVQ